VKSRLQNPFFILGLVLLWRILLLVFTVQPIPDPDAFAYDGGVVNFLLNGHYYNPSLAVVFPISGTEIYSTYPPLYQGALLIWMKLFGTSVISAMAMHVALFAVSGFLTVALIRRFFPAGASYATAVLLLFGLTFDDRPESLAFVFGLASLWLAARQISNGRFRMGTAAGLLLALLLGLYTSVIVGAYFFGSGFLACAVACVWRRRTYWFAPFIAAAVLFGIITFFISKMEPLWWAGFMESAKQQSVLTTGLHAPHGSDLIKLGRDMPVFLLGLAVLPLMVARRREVFATESVWVALLAGILVMGWVLLVASMTLLAPNYVKYAIFTQVILGAGLLALGRKYFPERERLIRVALAGCVLLVSVRAIGMTTWGVACAWKNSYQSARATVQTELEPYTTSDGPVLVSSAFLYQAADMRVKNPINSDWYFDHSHWTNNAEMNGLIQLQPQKLVLTQFDYYRGLLEPVFQLQQHPELVEIHVRNLAALRVPDASRSLQRVVQHISWAPVIVDLDWKKTPAP
jgi:hypothetical protein